jgi:hypothetical protein
MSIIIHILKGSKLLHEDNIILYRSETWPESAPKPPDYEITFKDGCIPPNLHNASDCPANFPTLDTLEYSEAYDAANQPETESGLMINPAVKAAVESQFAIPDFPPKKGETKVR